MCFFLFRVSYVCMASSDINIVVRVSEPFFEGKQMKHQVLQNLFVWLKGLVCAEYCPTVMIFIAFGVC